MQLGFSVILIFLSFGGYAVSFDHDVIQIADKLRCPTCQGLSVKDSESGLSVNMKEKIKQLLQAGKTEDEILQFFEERYGEWILRTPRMKGFNLILWIFPGILFFVAILFLVLKLKSNKLTGNKTRIGISDQDQAILERDLKKFQED